MDQDQDLEFDIIAGENSTGGIALMNIKPLRGFKGYLRNIYTKTGKLIWQKRAIRKAFARNYDAYIITGNPGIRSNWIIALWARVLSRPVFLWSHGLYGDEKGLKLWKNLTYFKLARNLLLYGENARNLLLERGFAPERMTVIYNSLDYDKHLAIRERIGDRSFIRNYFGNEMPIITFVGRLTPSKRVDMILNAMSKLDSMDAHCNLVIIGDGTERESLEKQIQRLRLTDRVWIYGETYDDHIIATFLHHSAACVSPGNVGLTAIHSLMFGTPVVTHNNPQRQMPEYEAITPSVSGSLFTEGCTDQLAAAIKPWLALTPQEREHTRLECQKVIEDKYNPNHQIEIIRTLFLSNR